MIKLRWHRLFLLRQKRNNSFKGHNVMRIIYNKNPLLTLVELDDNDKKEFWYKIKIKEMEDLLFGAYNFIESDKYQNKVKQYLDPSYYMSEEGKSKLDERCDELLECFLTDLMGAHSGDCTCVPASCIKCHAESILGINTIVGLNKYSANKISAAFGKNNEKSVDEALDSLLNYKPIISTQEQEKWDKIGGYEKHLPRWQLEAKNAYDWLLKYKIEYLDKVKN